MYIFIKSKFLKAIAWSGCLYGLYKTSSTFFTIKLFNDVSCEIFSLWASLNSIIFLILLFLDGGLRKSIPHFAQLFVSKSFYHRSFIYSVALVNFLLLLIVGIPLLIGIIYYLLPTLYTKYLLWPAILILIIEGISSFCVIIYQAHFLQYLYAIPYSCALLIETALNFFILNKYNLSQEKLLIHLCINKIIIKGLMCIIMTIIFWWWISRTKKPYNHTHYPIFWHRAFIKHTALMWASTLIKSLSERNFLLLLFTYSINNMTANLFKISHDSTIIFQRIAFKTIGVSDTAFLTQHNKNDDHYTRNRFKVLSNTIMYMSIPLILLVTGIFLYHLERYSTDMILIFIIFTIGYALEIILSPYERMLETQKAYRLLWISYIPYMFIFIISTIFLIKGIIMHIPYLLSIQIARAISACNIRYYSNNYFFRKNIS